MSTMAPIRFALFFRQEFEAGYRYLDKCGEFLVRAQQRLDLFPTGETSPQSGVLEAPDLGIKVEANTSLLRVTQELPEGDAKVFEQMCAAVSSMYQELFEPLATERLGVAVQSYVPLPTYQKSEAMTLEWGIKLFGSDLKNVAHAFGMVPAGQVVESIMRSGSLQLQVKIKPITFERVKLTRQTARPGASRNLATRIARQNRGAERLLPLDLSHAALFEVDASEDSPPPDAFPALFADLLKKESQVNRLLFG